MTKVAAVSPDETGIVETEVAVAVLTVLVVGTTAEG